MNAMKISDMKNMLEQCTDTARVLKSLAHPHRLQLLCHLSQGKMSVGELEKLCGISQSQVSQFLGKMKSEGLVGSTRDGKFVRYFIDDQNVMKLIVSLHKIYCP